MSVENISSKAFLQIDIQYWSTGACSWGKTNHPTWLRVLSTSKQFPDPYTFCGHDIVYFPYHIPCFSGVSNAKLLVEVFYRLIRRCGADTGQLLNMPSIFNQQATNEEYPLDSLWNLKEWRVFVSLLSLLQYWMSCESWSCGSILNVC